MDSEPPLPVSFSDVASAPDGADAKAQVTTYCCGRCRSSSCCCGRFVCTPKRKACCIAATVLLTAAAIVAIICGVYFGVYANKVSLAVGALSGSPLSAALHTGRHRRLLQYSDLPPSAAQPSSTASAYAQVRARDPAPDAPAAPRRGTCQWARRALTDAFS